ncbi:Protein phosphatase 2C [Spironucleus salmonicida]|nr:Protein phosphatase 2C [Spironucleus salmonicida]
MGCVGSRHANSYYENMLRKAVIYTKAKYKSLQNDLSKQQQTIDMLALDDFGLFITGTLNHGQRQMLIEKQPIYGREVVLISPKLIGHYKMLMYMFYGWPLSSASIDISFKEVVSNQLVTSVIYALNTVDIARSLNLAKQQLPHETTQLLAAWMSKCLNLEFLSLVGCGIMPNQITELAEGVLRLARGRSKITKIGRCEEVSINDQEAYMYDIPQFSPVRPGLLGLDLSRNKISDQGAQRMIDSLEQHQELTFLGLAECDLGNVVLQNICENLPKWKYIQSIDLSGNIRISDAGVEYLHKHIKKLHFCRLGHVYLADTKVTQKAQSKLNILLARNDIIGEIYDDLLAGAFTKIFNQGEMAGECVGKGSDVYIEYSTSDFCPVISNPDEQILVQKLFSKISIQQGYLHYITTILRETPQTARKSVTIADYTISVSETIGKRPEMEDVISIHHDFLKFRCERMETTANNDGHHEILICLFDGHGGEETSAALGILFPAIFADTVNAIMFASGLQHCCDLPTRIWEPIMFSVFQRCDDTLRLRRYPSGSTGVLCFVLDSIVITANVGDSRAIMCRDESVMGRSSFRNSRRSSTRKESKDTSIKESVAESAKVLNPSQISEKNLSGIPVPEHNFEGYFDTLEYNENVNSSLNPDDIVVRLSKDHKPDLPEEKRRIESVGGYVHGGRVLSTLAVARGFGDFNYKPSVACSPYVNIYPIQKKDEWLLICCDGVWDVLSDLDVALICHRCMTAGHAAIKIRDESYRLDSGDNISSVAVRLFLKE